MKDLLRNAFGEIDTELHHDLWPRMREKIESRRSVPVFDWALAAGVLVWIAFFPRTLIALLYHL